MQPKTTEPDLDLEFDETPQEIVLSLMSTIEHYRKKKKSLRAIHAALHKRGDLTLTFSSFRNVYYQQREKKS